MLPTLALALALAAPVPKVAPFPLRTDPLPKEFKLADLEKVAVRRGVDGEVAVLAWETTENNLSTCTCVLHFKKCDKADQEGRRYSFTFTYRHPEDTDWQDRFIAIPPVIPGNKFAYAGDAFHFGYQTYAHLPSDKELTAFLKAVSWTPKLGAEVETDRVGKRLTTKLAAGGFDRDAWKAHFDRDPPVDLFPELKEENK